MSTLWQEEKFKQICSRESLTAKTADIEKTIVVKENERARCDVDPTMLGRPRRKEVEWGETIKTNWNRYGLRLKTDNLRRCCRLQHRGAVQGWSETRWRGIAHHRGGREAWLASGWNSRT